MPLYPNVTVRLTNADVNSFAIMGKVSRALKQQGKASPKDITAFRDEAISEDDLLMTCKKWVQLIE